MISIVIDSKKKITYKAYFLKKFFESIIFFKVKSPDKVFLSSVSPLLFENLFLKSLFNLLIIYGLVEFIDDGLSGSIPKNRLNINNYCPSSNEIWSWDFKYFLKNTLIKRKLDFEKLLLL